MNEIDAAPCFVAMAIVGNVFRLHDALITQGGHPFMQLIEIVSMNEEIQIQRCPGVTQNAQSETADSGVPNFAAIEFRQ
jgi:hypothetical protein